MTVRRFAPGEIGGVAAVLALVALRWIFWDADFPPISGSLGEYADMGVNFVNVRAYPLTGFWNVEASPLLYLCPIYYAFVTASVFVLGHGFFSYRFASLLFGSLAVLFAWRAGDRVAGSRAGLRAALLIASDAIWFAYSRSEKQEVAAAFLILLAALSSGAATPRRRAFLAASAACAAVLVKTNAALPLAGLFIASFTVRDRPFGLREAPAFGAGALLVAAAGALFLAPAWIAEGNPEQVERMFEFYRRGVSTPAAFLDAARNLYATNLYLRSPAFLFGLLLSFVVWPRIRDMSPLVAGLAGIVLVSALSPLTNLYFPLRYRMTGIPAAALLLALAPNLIPERHRALPRYRVPIVLAMTVSVVVGAAQITRWVSTEPSHIVEISREVRAKLPPGTRVATNGWWGQTILLGTDFPEVPVGSAAAEAWLLVREPDGRWSTLREPDVDFSRLDLVYDRSAWFGARYMLYVRKP